MKIEGWVATQDELQEVAEAAPELGSSNCSPGLWQARCVQTRMRESCERGACD